MGGDEERVALPSVPWEFFSFFPLLSSNL